jgi:hypothetical protein
MNENEAVAYLLDLAESVSSALSSLESECYADDDDTADDLSDRMDGIQSECLDAQSDADDVCALLAVMQAGRLAEAAALHKQGCDYSGGVTEADRMDARVAFRELINEIQEVAAAA